MQLFNSIAKTNLSLSNFLLLIINVLLDLPRIQGTGGLEEVLLRFAINVWNHVESWKACNVQVQEKVRK